MIATLLAGLLTLTGTIPGTLADTLDPCHLSSAIPLRDAREMVLVGWRRWLAEPETLARMDAQGREGQPFALAFDSTGFVGDVWGVLLRSTGVWSCHGPAVTLPRTVVGVPPWIARPDTTLFDVAGRQVGRLPEARRRLAAGCYFARAWNGRTYARAGRLVILK